MSALPYAVYALCAGIVGYSNGIAQPGSPGYTPAPAHHLRALFENDSVSGQDCNYTHGSRVDYAQLLKSGNAWGLSLTQNIYTPELHGDHGIAYQHPYCGYLALGFGYVQRGEDFGSSTEFQVGTLGHASKADRVQNGLHELLHMDTWDGWQDQIRSEVTLQLTSRQDWRLRWLENSPVPGWDTDGLAFLRESVGTFELSGAAGFSYRFGRNLPPSSQVTGNSAAVYGLSTLTKPGYRREAISYFLVLECSLNYVARDTSLEGGVFHDFDRTCARVPWQPEGRLGGCLLYHGVEYYAGVLVHGRTYKTQDKNSVMGTFAISWHW